MELNRRELVISTLGAATACACAAGCSASRVGATPTMRSGKQLDVGAVSDFTQGVDDRFARTERVVLVREGEKLFAMSAICTHKACILKKRTEAELKCPCHGSHFSLEGKPLGGPATGTLPRFAIRLNEAGHVIVDTSEKFAVNQSADPRTFIMLGAAERAE